MRAALKLGRWTFPAPIGYLNAPKWSGKSLVPDPERAPLIAGRSGHYAYYHCQRQCRAVNVSKVKLEGAFVDELALLQPTPGYMRLVKDRILHVWEQRRVEAEDRTAEQQRRVSAIQQKLNKLDEAFLYSEVIDVTTYGRQRDKLREELTLAKIDHHAEAVDELDVEGILAFAERILPRASDLWVQGLARLQAAVAAAVLS